MPANHKDWTREEHILVFNLCCIIPFSRQHSRAPKVGGQGRRNGCDGMC